MDGTDRQPIGYWLKHLDRLIEDTFERALATERLTRRHWQTLNAVQSGPVTQAGLDEALAPFLADDPDGARAAVDDLVARGWMERSGGPLRLTAVGEVAFAGVRATVTATRRQVMDGVSPEEYSAVVDVLRRMSANLEPAAG